MDPRYLDTPERWKKLLDICLSRESVGFDTEFQEGRVSVWSLAVFTGKPVTPLGYYPARGYVLPAAALTFFEPLLTSETVVKWAHNAVADTRSVHNHCGISLVNVNDTLSWARVARPGLTSYGLKPLASLLLGKPSRPGFKEVMAHLKTISVKIKTKIKECRCGVAKCRKRKGHSKFTSVVVQEVDKEVDAEYTVHEIVPGHERWSQFLDYALEDAVDALELSSWLSRARHNLTTDTLSGVSLQRDIQTFLRSRC